MGYVGVHHNSSKLKIWFKVQIPSYYISWQKKMHHVLDCPKYNLIIFMNLCGCLVLVCVTWVNHS